MPPFLSRSPAPGSVAEITSIARPELTPSIEVSEDARGRSPHLLLDRMFFRVVANGFEPLSRSLTFSAVAHVSSGVDAQCYCCAFFPLLWLKARINGFIINHNVLNALDICVSDGEIPQRDFLNGLVSVCWRGHRFKRNLPIRSIHLCSIYCKVISALQHMFRPEINQNRHDHGVLSNLLHI